MGMDGIEHVVLLILENRSFDSLLGWLYEGREPAHTIPELPPGARRFEGLQGLDLSLFTNEAEGIASPPIRGASALNAPCLAPGEEFEHVNVQLFGKSPPGPGDTPTMKGFVKDYLTVLAKTQLAKDHPGALHELAKEVMESYTPDQLPVLNGLGALTGSTRST